MDPAWFGNLFEVSGLPRPAAWIICTFVSMGCGALVGLEREHAEKPAGLRTLVLICVGSTIFTFVSQLMATGPMSDPARISAQIVSGIGFLGAGAILRYNGTVVGLTTGAAIWTVAAVGMTVGSGHAFIGIVFTIVIFLTLTVLERFTWVAVGKCEHWDVEVRYRDSTGIVLTRIEDVLNAHAIAPRKIELPTSDRIEGCVSARVCHSHREHRIVLRQLADVEGVDGITVER